MDGEASPLAVLIACAAVLFLLIVFPLLIGIWTRRRKDSVWNKGLIGGKPAPAFVPAWFMDLAVLVLALLLLAALASALFHFFH